MTDEQKAPPIKWDHITLRHDRQEKERFMKAHHDYCSATGNEPTQGEFLMILLDLWESKEV